MAPDDSKTTTSYGVRVSADGKMVSVDVERHGNKASIDIETDAIGFLVAGLLSGAIESANRSGMRQSPLSKKEDLSAPPFAVANGVGLFDLDGKPNVIGLAASFGQTILGLGLPLAGAKQLGQALLAATVDSGRPQ